MASMSIDKEINQYLPQLGVEQKQSLLDQIKSLLKINNEPTAISREEYLMQYNEDLDNAVKEFEAGNYISHEELVKKSEKWEYED